MARTTVPGAHALWTNPAKPGPQITNDVIVYRRNPDGYPVIGMGKTQVTYDPVTARVTFEYPDGPAHLVGKAHATHVNAFLGDLGMSVAATRFRHEVRGPVLLIRAASGRINSHVYLNEHKSPLSVPVLIRPSLMVNAPAPARARRVPRRAGPTMPTITVGDFNNPRSVIDAIDAAVDEIGRMAQLPKEAAVPARDPRVITIPPGYVGILGRAGQTLVFPKRLVETFEAALESRREGHPAHPIAVGPTGTGKTEGLIALGAAAGLIQLPIVPCGGIETAPDWFGQTRPDAASSTGWTHYDSTLWANLVKAEANPDKSFMIVLDEVNRVMTAAAQNALFSLMDGSAVMIDPSTNRSIRLTPNVMLVATANIGAAYGATQTLDGAFRSRFWTNLVFDYLPENVEHSVLMSTGLEASAAKQLARAASELRKAHKADPFRSHLMPGTRELIAIAVQAKHDPAGVAGAWDSGITASFSNEGRNASTTEQARLRVIAEGVFASMKETK